ncbi:MAG: hypothetical protein HY363_06120 [Candidatus Aenigmarchaeota archaeon]|nr:hypothetical protein [Candidatus Aenigmarchaeota archaeon]
MLLKRKFLFDSKDRDILRLLYGAKRPLTSNAIAQRIQLTPPAIKPRLVNLQHQGIIRPIKIGALRTFERKFSKGIISITAPSKIFWTLNLKKRKT